nr:helix-turn-helix transcriptional regulator [Caloramator mitchellensis]
MAENAGFSLFHYYRLFQSVVGMPVMQYILKRRLCHAIYEISCGRKIIDVALSYGYDTHAGFFKAFKREYDCSPTQYLKKYYVLHILVVWINMLNLQKLIKKCLNGYMTIKMH